MIVASFPDEQKREACNPFFVDAFMKGCRDKDAVLSVADKHSSTLEEAYKHVLDAVQLRRVILGKRACVKKISHAESNDSSSLLDSDSSASSFPETGLVAPKQRRLRIRARYQTNRWLPVYGRSWPGLVNGSRVRFHQVGSSIMNVGRRRHPGDRRNSPSRSDRMDWRDRPSDYGRGFYPYPYPDAYKREPYTPPNSPHRPVSPRGSYHYGSPRSRGQSYYQFRPTEDYRPIPQPRPNEDYRRFLQPRPNENCRPLPQRSDNPDWRDPSPQSRYSSPQPPRSPPNFKSQNGASFNLKGEKSNVKFADSEKSLK